MTQNELDSAPCIPERELEAALELMELQRSEVNEGTQQAIDEYTQKSQRVDFCLQVLQRYLTVGVCEEMRAKGKGMPPPPPPPESGAPPPPFTEEEQRRADQRRREEQQRKEQQRKEQQGKEKQEGQERAYAHDRAETKEDPPGGGSQDYQGDGHARWQAEKEAEAERDRMYHQAYQRFMRGIWAAVLEKGVLRSYPEEGKVQRPSFVDRVNQERRESHYQMVFTSVYAYFYVLFWTVGLMDVLSNGRSQPALIVNFFLIAMGISLLGALPNVRAWMPTLIYRPVQMVVNAGLTIHEATVALQILLATRLHWIGTLLSFMFLIIPHTIGTSLAFLSAWVYGLFMWLGASFVDQVREANPPKGEAYYADIPESYIEYLMEAPYENLNERDKGYLAYLYSMYANT
jgi:hypothetical protein